MIDSKNIQDELNDLNSDLPLNNGNPAFSVPEGYFDNLAISVLARIKSHQQPAMEELSVLSSLLAGISKTIPYEAPDGYFEKNIQALPGLLKDAPSPVLAAITKNNPYTVPQNYFSDLPEQIVSRVTKSTSIVVSLVARRWLRTAAAALVGGALLIAGYHYYDKAPSTQVANNTTNTSKSLSPVQNEVIDQTVKKASTQELEAFVQNLSAAAKGPNLKTSTAANDVKGFLKDVSDKDMETFLSSVSPQEEEELTN